MLEVDIGSQASLQCYSNGDTRWFFVKSPTIPEVLISKKNIIIFYPASLQSNGDYWCYGLYNHTDEHFIASASVKVYGKIIECSNTVQCHSHVITVQIVLYFTSMICKGINVLKT